MDVPIYSQGRERRAGPWLAFRTERKYRYPVRYNVGLVPGAASVLGPGSLPRTRPRTRYILYSYIVAL